MQLYQKTDHNISVLLKFHTKNVMFSKISRSNHIMTSSLINQDFYLINEVSDI